MPESRVPAKISCPHCGGDEFIDGGLWGYHWLRFVPLGKRFFRNSPRVEVSACRACGRLSLWVDLDQMLHAMGS